MVRLKSAFIIKCEEVIKDANGNVTELRCTYIPESRSGHDTSGVSVKGVIHFVSAAHALKVEVRQYEKLFVTEDMNAIEDDFKNHLNPHSLEVRTAYAEPALKDAK